MTDRLAVIEAELASLEPGFPVADWVFKTMRELIQMVKDARNQHADEAKAKARPWIPTHGADLSGHDFGCEWIWICWKDQFRSLELKTPQWVNGLWPTITHWQPTAIRTPSPPEGQPE